MKIDFTKMEGCGNDYVYIDGSKFPFSDDKKPDFVRFVSDRHFGIGSDGVIFINSGKIADYEMEMYNADGSRSEMCGNGIRCVAKYVYDKGYWTRNSVDIESFGKIKHISLKVVDGEVVSALVDMGEPVLEPEKVPVNQDLIPADTEKVVMFPVSVDGKEYKITAVSMGNPHGIVYVDDVDSLDIGSIGPKLENHPFFPNRANIEFVQTGITLETVFGIFREMMTRVKTEKKDFPDPESMITFMVGTAEIFQEMRRLPAVELVIAA